MRSRPPPPLRTARDSAPAPPAAAPPPPEAPAPAPAAATPGATATLRMKIDIAAGLLGATAGLSAMQVIGLAQQELGCALPDGTIKEKLNHIIAELQ